MEFLHITDENEEKISINLNQIILVREVDDRQVDIVTAVGTFRHIANIYDFTEFLEKKGNNLIPKKK
ncbi:hypothetical protein ABS768_08615 [Flavobacterium sp. ST-75]|uniref:Uncharacterized protein n=1 Tax=Flavobacterium rhizophilum TaxID=3163296 RepID=A0ABW8YCT8_9FLAO